MAHLDDSQLRQSNPISMIGKLAEKEIHNLNEDLRKYPLRLEDIINKGSNCHTHEIYQVYNLIQDDQTVPHKLKNIIEYLMVSKLLEKDIIDRKYYTLIIKVVKNLMQIPEFRINEFADLCISKLLNLSDSEPLYIELLESHHFMHKICSIMKYRYDFQLELYELATPIKLALFKVIKEFTPEKIRKTIGMILEAQKYYVDLRIFKKHLCHRINCLIMEGRLPGDLAYSELKSDVENPEEPPNITIEDLADYKSSVPYVEAKKIAPIHMTNQEGVQVSVWQAVREDGVIIALKECIGPTVQSLVGYIDECKHLEALSGKSKNFLKFYGSELTTITIYDTTSHVIRVQMEFVEKTLKDDKLLRDQKSRPYNDIEIEKIYKQLILAFNLLRNLNILHCDIKPSNIMITNDLTIKIIDFNAAKVGIDDFTIEFGAVGTKDFMSPEIRKGLGGVNQAVLKEDKADV